MFAQSVDDRHVAKQGKTVPRPRMLREGAPGGKGLAATGGPMPWLPQCLYFDAAAAGRDRLARSARPVGAGHAAALAAAVVRNSSGGFGGGIAGPLPAL